MNEFLGDCGVVNSGSKMSKFPARAGPFALHRARIRTLRRPPAGIFISPDALPVQQSGSRRVKLVRRIIAKILFDVSATSRFDFVVPIAR
ncbi:hypothetical protein [Microbulbifer litoralis]|uniref:hypothetical protein n=1 Tax=Microbulbifer litoralis TaxID=2933965 RepID=UPI002028B492|nr:hypothetical protein [Microbulbifer sp. GX H0434]